MDKLVRDAVEKYQCSGCVCGSDISCYQPSDCGVGCSKHCAGTTIGGIGRVLLGLPKGFDRLGHQDALVPVVFRTHGDKDANCPYDMYNVPVWKHLDGGVILVRGYMPRLNQGFIHIIIEGDMGTIDCRELTSEDLDNMD